jgi:hypothetical protein
MTPSVRSSAPSSRPRASGQRKSGEVVLLLSPSVLSLNVVQSWYAPRYVPVSGLTGENVVRRTPECPLCAWYT